MSDSNPHNPIVRIAVFSARRPWLVLAGWLLVVAATFSLSFALDTRQATDLELMVGESQRAEQRARDAGLREPAVELVLVRHAVVRPSAPGSGSAGGHPGLAGWDAALADELAAELRASEHVAGVTGPLPATDGEAVLYRVEVAGDPDTAAERLDPLAATVERLGDEHPGLAFAQTGAASISADFGAWLGADLARAATTTLPVTLIILLIAVGAVVMAVLPIAVGSAAVLSAMGLWALASQWLPDSGMVPHVILLIGMAVGIDYALFTSRRYRDEAARGLGPVDAIEIAARTAGHSVLVSGVSVALALAGLLLISDALYSGIAIGAIGVVLAAMVSSATAMPALMRLLHRFVERPRVPLLHRLGRGEGAFVRRLVAPVVAHPRAALAAGLATLGLLAAPALGMHLANTTIDDYPRSLPALAAYDEVLAHYPAQAGTARIVLGGEGSPEAADRLGELVAAHPERFGEPAPAFVSTDGATAVVDLPLADRPGTEAAVESLRLLRTDLLPAAAGDGVEHAIGGDVAGHHDATQHLAERMPWVIAIVLALTFATMLAVYRSWAIAVITVVFNALSTLASFGLLVLIFQQSGGTLVSWVPLMLFVVLSGLSLDYHVLVVSRVREGAEEGLPIAAAVREGLARTAGVVTAAAAVMIAVFAVFGLLEFSELRQIGVGLALATLLDATLVRVVLLPAALVSAGRWLPWGAGRPAADARTTTRAVRRAADSGTAASANR